MGLGGAPVKKTHPISVCWNLGRTKNNMKEEIGGISGKEA